MGGQSSKQKERQMSEKIIANKIYILENSLKNCRETVNRLKYSIKALNNAATLDDFEKVKKESDRQYRDTSNMSAMEGQQGKDYIDISRGDEFSNFLKIWERIYSICNVVIDDQIRKDLDPGKLYILRYANSYIFMRKIEGRNVAYDPQQRDLSTFLRGYMEYPLNLTNQRGTPEPLSMYESLMVCLYVADLFCLNSGVSPTAILKFVFDIQDKRNLAVKYYNKVRKTFNESKLAY